MGGDHWHTGPIEVDNHLSRGFLVLRLLWIGELKRAAADLAAAIAVAEREGRTSSWMHAFRVDSAWFSGDPTGVLDAARRSMEQAEAFGSLFFRAVAFRAYGEALCLLGRHEEALAPLLESRPLAAKGSGAFQFEANHLAVLCEAGVGAGRFDDAAQWGQAAIESAQRSGSRLWELRAWTSRLALPASVLSDDEARAGFDRAWSLVDLTQGEGLRPKLEELAARREPDAERRRAMLLRARDGYARIGADHHAHRLAGLLGI
jgi:adenylate cyclase